MTLSITNFAVGYDSPIPYPDFHSKGPAVCTQVDFELYFPQNSGEVNSAVVQSLIKLCGECPYKAECLEWAVINREDGIWGGTTNAERDLMRGGLRSRTRAGNKALAKKNLVPPASLDLTSATSII
jgi:WhiB family redox-sensing transcriptional regulator